MYSFTQILGNLLGLQSSSVLLDRWLIDYPLSASALILVVLVGLALLLHIVLQRYLVRLATSVAKKANADFALILIKENVLARLLWILPLLIISIGIDLVPRFPADLHDFLKRLSVALILLVGTLSVTAFLSAINEIYNRSATAMSRPIKGYIQTVTIIVYILGAVLIIAKLADQSPFFFLSGIGAMMAVILLIFRDTLLGLVAGIQLTANDHIRVGDWIEVPQFEADGDVIDIALHSIKVRNWDNTVTVIPSHKFLEHSFKNWRSMAELGGRRIKRTLLVDLSSIKFLSEEEVARFGKFSLISDYIKEKKKDLEQNNGHAVDLSIIANSRHLTNIGTLRAYMIAYLRAHSGVHENMIQMVRQMEPTPHGLPMEVYAFTNNTAWVKYEGIQADIFDHFLAILPEFGLRAFQYPSDSSISHFSKGFEILNTKHDAN